MGWGSCYRLRQRPPENAARWPYPILHHVDGYGRGALAACRPCPVDIGPVQMSITRCNLGVRASGDTLAKAHGACVNWLSNRMLASPPFGSNPTMASWTAAASPETAFSPSHGASCPSARC